MDHTYGLLTKFNNGIPPKGSVAPWWETSSEGTVLLLEKGIEYGESYVGSTFHIHLIVWPDHSNMAHECVTAPLNCECSFDFPIQFSSILSTRPRYLEEN